MTDRTCYVDIEDSAGNKLGGGPIASITAWTNTLRLDKAGSFSFTMPANDPKAAVIENLRIASIYALVGGAWQYVGGGVIDFIHRTLASDGTVLLTASGDDLLRELSFPTLHRSQIGNATTPFTHAQAVAEVAALVGPETPGWVWTPDPSPAYNQFYAQFNFESPLTAAQMMAMRADSHFRMTGKRAISFGNTWLPSGLRAVRGAGELAPETCAITELQVQATSQDLVTRLTSFGGGSGKSILTMYQATNPAPSGYTRIWFNATKDAELANGDLELQLGHVIHRVLEFKDITPLSSTALDIVTASNELQAVTATWLRRHSRVASAYSITLEGCEKLLRPLTTLRVVYRDPLMGLTLDEDLYVLEVTWEGGPDAPRVTRVIVGDSDWWPESDAEIVATNIRQGMVYQVHPQMSANSYVIAYAKSLDDVSEAQFRFRFDDEVWQIARATFDFQLLPLESTVKAVGLEQSTGGTITTSFTGDSGTPSAANSGAPSVANSGAPSSDVSGAVTGNTSAPSSDATGAVTGNTGGATGDTGSTSGDTGSPTGGDIISGGQHKHYLPIAAGAAAQAVTSDGAQFHTPATYHEILTSQSGNHVHAVTAHTHTLNSHAHTLGGHTHTLGNHTHTLGNHTHTLGNHTHTLSAHTHSLAHTHTITHSHVFTPSVYMQYGLFRDTAGNTFALADLEYSLDGTTWYGFSPGVNGYAFMGDGWNRIDITDLVSDTSVGGSFTPLAANWLLRIRRKTAGALKKATIDAQLTIRCMIRGYSFS